MLDVLVHTEMLWSGVLRCSHSTEVRGCVLFGILTTLKEYFAQNLKFTQLLLTLSMGAHFHDIF